MASDALCPTCATELMVDGWCPQCERPEPRKGSDLDTYNFDDPVRRRSLRAQLRAMEYIRDAIVMPLGDEDRKRWVAALQPLTDRIAGELALQEGTGTLGALLTVFPVDEMEEVG